ncbi:MAG: hypothetical protein JNM00_16410, partial [Flavobacteriales bacterium]|nr:hypothetical protein [Flavobacteriales bacterium]
MRPHNHIISPSHVLVLLACIGGAMALLMVVFPQKGISLGNYKLRFITWAALTDTSDVELLGDIDAFLAAQDTTAVDSVLADTIPTRPNLTLTSLQYQNNDASSLRLFFEKADAASAARQNVHVFHYGDSQIESDRISSFLREQLQSLFGGGGPGWLAPLPITSSMNINQKQSDNWLRYTAFGYDDGKLASKRFGALASCFRFTPATKEIPTDTTEAWIEFVPSAKSGSHCAGYDVVKIWLGYHRQPVQLEVWITDSLHYSETIEAGDFIQCKSYHTGFSPKKLKLVLRGTDSPDIHGIVLEKEGGIT